MGYELQAARASNSSHEADVISQALSMRAKTLGIKTTYMYMYTCVYIYIYIYVYIDAYVYVYICMVVYVLVHLGSMTISIVYSDA